MKRYRFRLDGVLRVRKVDEALALQHVAMANRALRLARSTESQALDRYAQLSEPATESEIGQWQDWQAENERVARVLVGSQHAVRELIDEQRGALNELALAKRNVAILERLRANGRAAWLDEFAKEEQRVLDDVVAARMRSFELSDGK